MAYPTGELSVDLRAITDNFRYIQGCLIAGAECGAVVKADAYGLGVERIAPRIYETGCRKFFVANLKEAIKLRSLVGLDAQIFVLSGCIRGAESEFIARGFIPVLVSAEMLSRWVAAGGGKVSAALKVNTGMGRLGIELRELEQLIDENQSLLKRANITYLMSHFACADQADHTLTAMQQQRFALLLERFRGIGLTPKATLANSGGIFRSDAYHYDLVRPGIALFGGNPGVTINPMRAVVGLTLPVIQVRDLPVGDCVGYGATRAFSTQRKIAIVAGGYADGMMRALSNRGWGFVQGAKVPIVGRISMDSTLFDISDIANPSDVVEGDGIEVLGSNVLIDDMAMAADTISYEVLTSIGERYQRSYIA
ncbi:MAG: alanine racemase [Alteromonadaceae bacterium]|nr:MAG: alanine racemase [Alteromonadaceae bacterium]